MSINRHLIGNTIRLTWVSSDITPSTIIAAVYDKNETLVDSASMVSSGNGHYYHDHTIVDSGQAFYVAQTLATINGKPYKDRKRFQAILGEV